MRHLVPAPLVSAPNKAGLQQLIVPSSVWATGVQKKSCVPSSLAKGLISRLPEEEVGQGELIQCIETQGEQRHRQLPGTASNCFGGRSSIQSKAPA